MSICEICGSTNTELIKEDEIFEYKGSKYVVPDYERVYCRDCGETVVTVESVIKSIPILEEVHRRVDGGFKRTLRKR